MQSSLWNLVRIEGRGTAALFSEHAVCCCWRLIYAQWKYIFGKRRQNEWLLLQMNWLLNPTVHLNQCAWWPWLDAACIKKGTGDFLGFCWLAAGDISWYCLIYLSQRRMKDLYLCCFLPQWWSVLIEHVWSIRTGFQRQVRGLAGVLAGNTHPCIHTFFWKHEEACIKMLPANFSHLEVVVQGFPPYVPRMYDCQCCEERTEGERRE